MLPKKEKPYIIFVLGGPGAGYFYFSKFSMAIII